MILQMPPFGISGAKKEMLQTALYHKVMTAAADQPRRPRRQKETYGLACWNCEREIEIPVSDQPRCPHCQAVLDVQIGDAK